MGDAKNLILDIPALAEQAVQDETIALEALQYLEPMYWAPYYRFLYLLAQVMQPVLSVECGVHRAFGSACMKAGYPAGRVVGIDCAPHPQAETIVAQFGLELRLGSTCPGQDDLRYIGILYLDSTVGMKRSEWDYYLPRMAPGGIVCMDDLRSEEGWLLDWIPSLGYPYYMLHELHEPVGWGLVCL